MVVEGSALVTIDESVKVIGKGQSTYVPLGSIHRLENQEKKMLTIIEVQIGTYLGEDDIIRYEDIYSRNWAQINISLSHISNLDIWFTKVLDLVFNNLLFIISWFLKNKIKREALRSIILNFRTLTNIPKLRGFNFYIKRYAYYNIIKKRRNNYFW